jgi:hypothetical protein
MARNQVSNAGLLEVLAFPSRRAHRARGNCTGLQDGAWPSTEAQATGPPMHSAALRCTSIFSKLAQEFSPDPWYFLNWPRNDLKELTKSQTDKVCTDKVLGSVYCFFCFSERA